MAKMQELLKELNDLATGKAAGTAKSSETIEITLKEPYKYVGCVFNFDTPGEVFEICRCLAIRYALFFLFDGTINERTKAQEFLYKQGTPYYSGLRPVDTNETLFQAANKLFLPIIKDMGILIAPKGFKWYHSSTVLRYGS